MDTTPRKSLHPLMAVAAIAVIVLSVVGVGAITGLIPISKGTPEPVASPVAESATTPAQATPPAAKAPAPVRQAAPRPAEPVIPPAPVAAQPGQRQPVQVATSERSTPQPKSICIDCGTIESVREIKQAGDGSGLGAVAGGVAGAVLGNQVGGGSGRNIATVVGAVGGAVAGHQVEKHVKSSTVYEVTVRMDDGNVRTFSEANPPSWRAGDKVRIQGDRLTTQG